jgi:parallel beta-helix repeat protein
VIGNVLIEGNVLTGSTQRSGLILAMADEGGRGNVIDGVTVRGNTITGNNHLGITVVGLVRNVSITGNTISENGRQAIAVADDPGVSGVTITGNNLVQSANNVCQVDCSWYQVAQVEKGARAAGVSLAGNYYAPGAPVTIGITDPSPASTPFTT